mmetsp:Transcript_51744/g.124603  ORF Transcript_51744/g.124603 Transcript_51744/m.124603 type:complete len:578 (+) Transcript_51744:60-1793(+)
MSNMEEGSRKASAISDHNASSQLNSIDGQKNYGSTGAPSPAAHVGIPTVCWFILVVELCERLSFYTFTGSQAFFLEHLGFGTANASGLNATMWTLCTVLAIFASWAADVVFGRYATILVAGLTYFVGTLLASIAAFPAIENATLYFVGVMAFLPLGTAGIKSNISNFGADQYDPDNPNHAAAQERFFSIFYLSINLGAGVAYGFFTTFASSGGPGVPKRFGYFTAYIIMTGCMLAAVCIFRAGRSGYRVHPLQESSALASVGKVLTQHARAGCWQASLVCCGSCLLVVTIVLSCVKACVASSGQAVLVAAFVTAACGLLAVVVPCLDPWWLGASSEGGPTQTETDVQGLLRVMPVLFTGNLSFSALYNSMQFWYQLQACQMDLRIGGNGFQLSGSFFNVADCVAIVIFTPLLVDWLNPVLEKVLGRQMTHGIKFGMGMLIAGISVLSAARLEQVRRGSAILGSTSNCAPPGVYMSSIPGAWMMVPFFLMGIGEIYSQPTLLHFAYSKSPATMRTLVMAISLFIQGVSSAIFAVLVEAMSAYITNDLNHGHLEYGYYCNIVIGAIFYLFFMMVLRVAP